MGAVRREALARSTNGVSARSVVTSGNRSFSGSQIEQHEAGAGLLERGCTGRLRHLFFQILGRAVHVVAVLDLLVARHGGTSRKLG
ncbi:hypothetical protein sce2513 [Sorangium cellulosum So ce56]|uniref:Uncharacterized protein n=1 Tax=Sorangium cellulosum (strain So ce56) TaxID=448385 RepID=A9G6B4_SORC5|nr:hypothetical protein sce2513 [Sorangium cellulosum So ce56]